MLKQPKLTNVTLNYPDNPRCPKCSRFLYKLTHGDYTFDCIACGRKWEYTKRYEK